MNRRSTVLLAKGLTQLIFDKEVPFEGCVQTGAYKLVAGSLYSVYLVISGFSHRRRKRQPSAAPA
ncbi:MAG: hypothetical protein ACR2G5_14305 [Pyrinomonadaceae bacterium]